MTSNPEQEFTPNIPRPSASPEHAENVGTVVLASVYSDALSGEAQIPFGD